MIVALVSTSMANSNVRHKRKQLQRATSAADGCRRSLELGYELVDIQMRVERDGRVLALARGLEGEQGQV